MDHPTPPKDRSLPLVPLGDALRRDDRARIRALVDELRFYDVADVLELLDEAQRRAVLEALGRELDPRVLAELRADVRNDVVQLLGPESLGPSIARLETDDAVEVLEGLHPAARAEVIDGLPIDTREQVQAGLAYPLESAGRLAQPTIVSAAPDETVATIVARLRGLTEPVTVHNVFVVDGARRPLGTVSPHQLVRAAPECRAEEVMTADVDLIPAEMDQEDVAALFRDHDLMSAPVVDGKGRIIGEITVDDVVDVIGAEAEEDLLRLGGLSEDDLYRSPLATVRSRSKWLLVNLGTAIVASIVIAQFDVALEEIVALAILMPIVAALGGNAGIQTMTVAVRALAARELVGFNTARFVAKEVVAGVMNGVLFATIMGAIAAAWFGSIGLAAVMAAAMVTNIVVATAAGALIPATLDRLGADPALGSSVFLTTVTDSVGFLTFLGLATLLLL